MIESYFNQRAMITFPFSVILSSDFDFNEFEEYFGSPDAMPLKSSTDDGIGRWTINSGTGARVRITIAFFRNERDAVECKLRFG